MNMTEEPEKRPRGKYVAGKRERNKAANRAAFLESARACFIEHGYEAITVRDIIRGTDLATGTFYNYFADKREVLDGLVMDRMSNLTQQLSEIRRNATSMSEFVHGAYLAAFTTVADDPIFYQILTRNSEVMREMHGDHIMGISVKALEEDIRDGIARGIFPEVDVEYLAAAFFGVAFEMGRNLAQRDNRDPKQAADFATRLFIQGLKVDSAVEEVAA